MAKLHELLAVTPNLKGQAEATRKDLKNTFEKKRPHFEERVVSFDPIEGEQGQIVEERRDIQTTVGKELDWIAPIIAKALDAAYQVEVGNGTAKADVVLEDGTTILTGVPATALLELDKRLTELDELVKAVPTLDPVKGFVADDSRGGGIYKAREEARWRTEKKQRAIVLYDATDKHPAQTQLISEDVKIGKIITQEWSGAVTVEQKGNMIGRLELLKRAVKRARSRANEVEVDTDKNRIGQKILSFVFKGTK